MGTICPFEFHYLKRNIALTKNTCKAAVDAAQTWNRWVRRCTILLFLLYQCVVIGLLELNIRYIDNCVARFHRNTEVVCLSMIMVRDGNEWTDLVQMPTI